MEKGFIFSLILAAIVGIFALNNAEKVSVDLIFTTVKISQAIIIFISAFLGAIIVAFLGWVKELKFKKEIKDLNQQKQVIEQERNKLVSQLESKEEQIMSLYKINTNIPSKDE